MHIRWVLGLVITVASGMAAQMCEPGPTLSTSQVETIAKNFESKYADAFDQGDAKSLASLYTEDATVMAEYGAVQQGRARIEKALASLFASSKQNLEDTPAFSRAVTNDVIVVQGTMLRHHGLGRQAAETGLYTHILVQQDSEWRLAAVQYSIKAHIPNQSEFLRDLNSKSKKPQ